MDDRQDEIAEQTHQDELDDIEYWLEHTLEPDELNNLGEDDDPEPF